MAEVISQDVVVRAVELQRLGEARRQAEAQRQAEQQAAADAAALEAERTRPRTVGQVGKDVGLQLLQGAVGLGQAAYGVGNIATLGALDRATGFSENFQRTQDILNQAKTAQTQAAQQRVQEGFEQGIGAGLGEAVTSPLFLQDLLIGNLPSLIPGAAAARGAGVAAAEFATARGLAPQAARQLVSDRAEQAVLRATAAQTAGATNVEAIQQIREAGGTELEQQLGGVGAGLAAGLVGAGVSRLTGAARLEAAAAGALPGGVGGALAAPSAGLARAALGGAAREAGEEYLQSGSEQVAQNIVTPGRGIWEGVGQQSALGALAGGILGGGMGATVALTSPRANSTTALGINIREAMARSNAELGAPLSASPLIDPVLPSAIPTLETGPLEIEQINLAETPLPGELPLAQQLPLVEEISFDGAPLPRLPRAQVTELPIEEIAGAPAPLRTLFDITGRQPRIGPAPTMGVEEIPAPPLTGLLSVIEAQRTRGQLGGTDLFAGALPPEGAFPAAAVPPAAAPTPAAVSPTQAALDFAAEPPTWKRSLARELGLKPASFRGKAWEQFTAAAEQAGVTPGSPEATAFLQQIAPQLAADPATAPLFAAKLADKYGPAAPVAPAVADATAPENAPVSAAAQIEDPTTRQAAVLNEVVGPAAIQEGATPGSPSQDTLAPPVGIDQTVAKYQSLDPTASTEQNIAEAYMDLLADATSTELLDETFIAVKNHPGWQQLSDDQRTEIAEEFELRYARIEGGTPGKFDTAPAVVKPIPTQQFASLVANANRFRTGNDPEIIPLEDVAQFEAQTGQAAPPSARGVFAGGRIYLIRQNLGSPKDLALTLAHERGHHGLASLLGDRLTAVTNRLWTNAALRDRIKGKMQQGLSRPVAAEEVLADMLAGGEKVNGDVVTKARGAIENTFARLLGYRDLKMTNAEVDALLRDVGAVMRGTPAVALHQGDPEHLRGLTSLMGDPASVVAGDARFSRALGDLDAITAAADVEGDGTRRTFNDVTKALGQASLDTVKNLGASVNEGGVFSALLSAVPLNQLVNLYGKLFGRLLNEFARLKRGKESSFNKALTQPGDLTYRDQAEKITTSPMQLSKRLEVFQRKQPAKAAAWNNLQQFSTLYRLWPDSAWQDQSALNYAEQSFTEDERRQALADLQKLWKVVGSEGQQLFRESQAVYSRLWGMRFEALANELSRATGIQRFVLDANGNRIREGKSWKQTPEFWKEYGQTIDSALNRLQTGPYSPLQRYGDYLVTVRDAEGKIAWFSGHDTKAEADTVAAQLAQSDFRADDQFRINTTARTSYDWQRDGINDATIGRLEKVAQDALPAEADAGLREEVRRGLVEAYLQSLPQQSFLQHANKRKNVAGFTMDAARAFNDYSVKAGRSIASLQFDGRISGKLNELQSFITDKARDGTRTDTTKLQRVLDAVKAQHSASQNFERSPVADALGQAGFIWFLTSPSQLFINSMQTFMVTLPRLAGTYGNAAGLKAVKNALGAFAKSRGDLLGDKSVLAPGSAERRVLEALHQRGVLDFTLAHDMTGLAQGEASAMSGHYRRGMEIASAAMHRSEVFNRQVAALATTRLELEKRTSSAPLTDEDIAALADVAEEMVLTTQFDYSQSNKSTISQGPWRKLIMQFQEYRLNMLAMMAKDIRDGFLASGATKEEKQTARRALAWMLGAQLTITGAAGTVLAPFVFAIADMFRDDDDLLDSRTEFTRAAPQWLAHGIVSGVLDTRRLGADSLIPILSDRAYAPKDASAQETFDYYVMRNIGPWAGLLGGVADGTAKIMNGDFVGATKGLLPAPLRDFYRAVYESQAGARDARQVVYYEPGIWDTVTGAMGLRSGERREAEELRGASYEANQRAQTLKQRYLGRLAMGHAVGDQDLVNEAMGSIQAWNSAHPDLAMRAPDIRRAVINRARAQVNADLYGVPSARPPSQSIIDALAL